MGFSKIGLPSPYPKYTCILILEPRPTPPPPKKKKTKTKKKGGPIVGPLMLELNYTLNPQKPALAMRRAGGALRSRGAKSSHFGRGIHTEGFR